MKKFTSVLAAALLVFSVAGANLAAAAEPNTIAVSGMAEQEVAPDMAYIDVGINVRQMMRKLPELRKHKLLHKSAERFWGLPLPIMICKTQATIFIRNIR